MENKENVYGKEIKQTENAASTATGREQTQNTAPEESSTDLGKFRDVNALLRAYEALESEFTRRSQRLKELEREADNLSVLAENGRGKDGVEKLRKNAAQRRTETKVFNDFVSELESVGAHTENTLEAQTEKPTDQIAEKLDKVAAESVANKEQTNAKPSVAGGNGEEKLSADALYELVCRDEGVRLKVIGEYLSSIGRSGAPLMSGGAGTLVAPPMKPKTIGEAGSMALRFFKNEGVQA